MLDVLAIAFDGLPEKCGGIAIATHELCRRREGQVHKIVEYKNLPVAIGAGANANGGYRKVASHRCRHFAWNAFKHECACSSVLERGRICLQLCDRFVSARLNVIAPHAMYTLRRESEMADDRNLGIGESFDKLDTPSLDLDCLSASLFHKSHGICYSFRDCAMVAAERHVCDNQSASHGAAHSARMVQHLVYGNRERIIVAEHNHRERITYENDVDARLVDQPRRCIVICGESRNRLSLPLHLAEGGYRNFGEGNCGGRRSTRRSW